MGIAEIEQHHLAAIVFAADRFALVIGQVEIEIRHMAGHLDQSPDRIVLLMAGSQTEAGQRERYQQGEARERELHANINHENIGSGRDT
ncbi:hypothetical protein DYGSA30_40930 [Dyella sp. GSA-30]|nr:hypothetical protein DYGSA30_40930 [Dyella sp. GSA-30]